MPLNKIKMKNICVIGLGNMGSAIYEKLGSSGSYKVFGCEKEDDINEKLKEADIFFIAVKPQNFKELAALIKIDLSEKVAISIMAGVSIANLQSQLRAKKVVRTLPNLALKIGESMTEWKCSEEISDEEKDLIKKILQMFGKEVEVVDEDQINIMSVMSGCGPAFFAFLAEIIAKAGIAHGIDDKSANEIALQTLIGTAKYIEAENLTPKELREKVTSKGGITHAAVTHLQDYKFAEIFKEAFEKAISRSKELNN